MGCVVPLLEKSADSQGICFQFARAPGLMSLKRQEPAAHGHIARPKPTSSVQNGFSFNYRGTQEDNAFKSTLKFTILEMYITSVEQV